MNSETSSRAKTLVELFFVFFKIGAVTFGGGLAMLPIIEKELVIKRNWVTKDTLLDYFAIGQATPGIIAVNVATFLGYSRAGILGAIIATLGVVTPSIIIISIIAKFLSGFSENITVKKALAGINVVVAALLTKVLWGFRKKIFSSILAFILFLLAFLGIAFFNVNTILIVVASIFIGLGFFFLNNNSSNSSTGKE
ncbi:MAG: chromate transporter [Spirochaetaceae bacterium]|nr:chromate transporter [Spirochaetaceae bacterium]